VRRYLSEKAAWIRRARPQLRHTIVVPGRDDRDVEAGLAFVRCPALPGSGGYRLPLRRANWIERLVAERPALIEAGDPYVPGFAAREAGRRLGIPVIGFCHSDLTSLLQAHFGAWTAPAARKLMARFCDGFDALVAPSHAAARTLENAGLSGVRVVPLGADIEVFRPQPERRAWLRRRLGVGPGERLLIFAGRPAPEKRLDLLVETVRALGPGFRLVLVGCGDRLPTDPQVMALPFEPDARRLSALLAGADAFVHANPHETLGLIALEAMACGVPVVGVASGGIGEIVDPGAGELANEATPGALAGAVRRLFERDLEAVGEAARRHVVRCYSWAAAFERLTALYYELTGVEAFRAPGAVRPGPTP
jgi:alpha-1,6-mannosyltransferase